MARTKTRNAIKNGIIWQNEAGNWCRKCQCGCILEYSLKNYNSKYHALNSHELGRACKKCNSNNSGEKAYFYGKKHTKETKQKISKSNIGKHKMSPENRKKISITNKNRIQSEEHRRKNSEANSGTKNHSYGKKPTKESTQKQRASLLKRFKKLGIPASIDSGAPEFFEYINKLGFNFKVTQFRQIGYIADGYDKKRHIWCEFDKPDHNKPSHKRKDLVRQNNIIKYFESIGNPLNGFVRILADKNGKPIGSICVYKSKWNISC